MTTAGSVQSTSPSSFVIFRRVRRGAVVLGLFDGAAGGKILNHVDQKSGAQIGQISLDDVTGFVGANGPSHFGEHAARVECGHHTHDGDAGLRHAIDHGSLHRRRTAISRQKRRMNVDHPEPRETQQALGDDLAVRGDDAEIGRPFRQRVRDVGVAQPPRLKHRKRVREGSGFDR
jgi:hypothetical protein